jgi:hypothetical protein
MGKNVTPYDKKTICRDTLQKQCQVDHVNAGFLLIHSGTDKSAFNRPCRLALIEDFHTNET